MKKLFALVLLVLSFSSFASSWQAYVDDQLMATGFFDGCSIMGHDGNTWALKNLRLSRNEITEVSNQFENPRSLTSVTLQAHTYVINRSDESTLAGRNSFKYFWSAKTLKTFILCVGPSQYLGQGANVVEKLAQYLRDNEY